MRIPLFLQPVISRFLGSAVPAGGSGFEDLRRKMLEEQIRGRSITDSQVLSAMGDVPREVFIPEHGRDMAYEDHPVSIGYGQTISQPYIVAYMTEVLQLSPGGRVLEIGTGSGYQTAVLGRIAREVYSLEVIGELAEKARRTLSALGYQNIHIRQGNGFEGWQEHAPFDAVIVTAAPEEVPSQLIRQMKTGGRMVIPVGNFFQQLYLITKTTAGEEKRALLPVRFVPMVGRPQV